MIVGIVIFSIIFSFAIAFLAYAQKGENGAFILTNKSKFLLIFVAGLPFTFVLGLLIAFLA